MHKYTYAVTHSPVFERLVERSRPAICAGPHHLLEGEAAQDAMVALFDPFGTLSSEPTPVEAARAPARRARPTRNSRSGWIDEDAEVESTEPMLVGYRPPARERSSSRR